MVCSPATQTLERFNMPTSTHPMKSSDIGLGNVFSESVVSSSFDSFNSRVTFQCKAFAYCESNYKYERLTKQSFRNTLMAESLRIELIRTLLGRPLQLKVLCAIRGSFKDLMCSNSRSWTWWSSWVPSNAGYVMILIWRQRKRHELISGAELTLCWPTHTGTQDLCFLKQLWF